MQVGQVIGAATSTIKHESFARERLLIVQLETLDGRPDDRVIEEILPTDDGETWATWDREFVYVGVRHPDVALGGSEHWLVVTFSDGGTGAPEGPRIGTQAPRLACPAQYALRWKADDSYTDLQTWDGAAWTASSNAMSSP